MTRDWTITAPIGAKSSTRRGRGDLERSIAALAERQHGIVALPQLVVLGLSPKAVRDRAEAGRLHRVHQGVYAVGHPLLTAEGRWMAAVLACGDGALLSHRSAAILWGLRDGGGARVDVSTTHRVGRRRAGIRVHWRPSLAAADAGSCRGVPCTSVALTLLDLAAVASARELENACDRAEQLRFFDGRAIDELLARVPGARGTRRLRTTLERLDPLGPRTRTEIERLMLALCRAHPLPQPVVNGWIQLAENGFQPDFLWPEAKLIVETDGGSHRTRKAFEQDRRRDQLLAEAGYVTLRFTWRQITEEPERVARTIAAVIDQRAGSRTSLRGNPALDRRSPGRTISV